MIKRLIPALLLILVVIVGCSRKDDDELDPRIGDLQVRCQVIDLANLPETFSITVSVYSDTGHTLLKGSKTVTTKKDSVNTVEFVDMPVSFMYVKITVNVAELGVKSCDEDLTVFVKQNEITTTLIRVMTVYANRIECGS